MDLYFILGIVAVLLLVAWLLGDNDPGPDQLGY